MTRIAELLALVAVFLLALVLAPLAFAAGLVWFAARLLVYLFARRTSGEIVGWVGEGNAEVIEEAKAFPRLAFQGHDGVTHVFTSRMGFNIYDDPPPRGAQPIRYHLMPRLYAEIDDRAHWFTGPVLAIAVALLGSLVASVWRLYIGAWFA